MTSKITFQSLRGQGKTVHRNGTLMRLSRNARNTASPKVVYGMNNERERANGSVSGMNKHKIIR